MKILEYYSIDGSHMVFANYGINKSGDVKNTQIDKMITQHKIGKYNIVSISHRGKRYNVRVSRALASTFIGKPPTLQHTADHIDRNSMNDVLDNICWANKSDQVNNRDKWYMNKSAFVIVRNGIEHTAKEWEEALKDNLNAFGRKFTAAAIQHYTQRKQHGFQYKTFQKLRREVWRSVKGSKNNKGTEWFISNMNRMKYKTKYAENVLNADQLYNTNGYPMVIINGKKWFCHELSMMMFRPNEYAARLVNDIILHKNDNKLDFNPFRLRFGSPSDNTIDAHNNGKYDNTKTSRKIILSYINGVFEKEHESIHAAVKYLCEHKYPKASIGNLSIAVRDGKTRYGRTWQ
ncbi:hypothetical protein ATCVNTS1_779R [Acanthocystis turfacea Chlorella virus NTS-1]|nr:hypothetical protein ATCVNTS1_779R [Acanthocystis turfacea Chlorella virus NTS-1]